MLLSKRWWVKVKTQAAKPRCCTTEFKNKYRSEKRTSYCRCPQTMPCPDPTPKKSIFHVCSRWAMTSLTSKTFEFLRRANLHEKLVTLSTKSSAKSSMNSTTAGSNTSPGVTCVRISCVIKITVRRMAENPRKLVSLTFKHCWFRTRTFLHSVGDAERSEKRKMRSMSNVMEGV